MIKTILSSRENLIVKEVNYCEIFNFNDETKFHKPFKLREIKSVSFEKNNSNIFAKKDLEQDFKEYDILNPKVKEEINNCIDKKLSTMFEIKKQQKPIGISVSKYNSLLKTSELIPQDFRKFYKTLPIIDDKEN